MLVLETRQEKSDLFRLYFIEKDNRGGANGKDLRKVIEN